MKADKILMVMFLAVFILQGTAYAQEPPKATFIHGKITDQTGAPIGGAEAELIRQSDGVVVDSIITEADGLYIVKMNFLADEGPVDMLLKVSKPGYSAYQEEMYVQGGSPPEIVERDILLTEKSEEEQAPQPEISPQETDAPQEILPNYENQMEVSESSETTTSTMTVSPATTTTIETPPETLEPQDNGTGDSGYQTQFPNTPKPEIISSPSSTEAINALKSKNTESLNGEKTPSEHEEDPEAENGLLKRGLEWIRGLLRRIFS